MNDVVMRLQSRLESAKAERRSIVAQAAAEGREALSFEEDADFRARSEEINKVQERINDLAEQDARGSRVSAVQRGNYRPGTSVYGPEQRNSYFADLTAVARGGDYEAQQRLSTYAQEQRDLNRADGSGGFFVPPAWLVNEFVGLPRAGRVTADLLNRRPLPAGTDSINVPKILTGTATAIQPADNDLVQEVDLTDTSITAPVRTIAGQQDVAQQLLDQSPVNFDEIIFRDLLADFNAKLNAQVLNGTGATGQVTGLRSVSGIETVTWTSTTPNAGELYRRVADAISRISSNLYAPPNVVVMHPRRWAWLLTQTHSSSRPLIVPSAGGPMNAPGVLAGGAEGRVGELAGLPVYVDGGLPTNLGAGLNEDVILVLNTAETYLYESTVRTRVMPETLSGTLTVRLQLFGYLAQATRQAKSIAQISGTGLTPPVFS